MATITATLTGSTRTYDVFTWPAMAGSDVGAAVDVGPYTALSVQGKGDGTTFTMTGSNDSGTTYSALGSGLTATFASSKTPVTAVNTLPQYIRPEMTGGTNSTVTMMAQKQV